LQSVLETCTPRPEILAGTFNTEVFTASLGPVIEHYRHGSSSLDSIYTNAELFFKEATYPTQGMRQALSDVFRRISGDTTASAIQRLETAFGGGKTHTLIACTHIAHQGKKLLSVIKGIIDEQYLPDPGTVAVVGIAGEEIPVHQPKGSTLVPYTLWGEIAYQIGGEALYHEVEDEANSFAAPGKTYFNKVFSGRKVMIMLDELAQYAARLEAARTDGGAQLAAFLMTLHSYARNNPGVAIVLTLASASDAFGKQTEQLTKLISEVRGEDINEDDALGLGEKAVKGVASVVARDAVQITPVQASEISAVFAKRLFVAINSSAAQATAEEYTQMYRRNASSLPDEATTDNFQRRMTTNYPFHPTLVDFLNMKLTSAENFQGTRGVLRVLSLAVRSLWQNRMAVPMIHTCHLDLRSDRVVNEILGRTGSSDLMFVLNADVGSVDTGSLEGGYSNSELADQRNPHPEGYPLYEYTWKTVFLHSIVGREEGLASRIFGLTEADALFSVSFPGLTPPQVHTALEEINESAFYLRYEQGKYYASEEPTINSVLARIRRTLNTKQIDELLDATARKVITDKTSLFHVEHDVALPEHLPDGKGRLQLGVVALTADSVDIEAMVTTKGENKPREQQNLIFVLVPETVHVKGVGSEQPGFFEEYYAKDQELKQRIAGIARQVKAMRLLNDKPQNYGVNPHRLEDGDFKKRHKERENALVTSVSSIYTGLYYPSTAGYIVRQEIKTAGGEGGAPFIELIKQVLIDNGEILTAHHTQQSDLLNLHKLFFESKLLFDSDTITLEKMRSNFCCMRSWPVLESAGVLEQIVRAGVQKNLWCIFRMEDESSSKPDEFYDQEKQIPMGVNLSEPGYTMITTQGAKQRGWTVPPPPDPFTVQEQVVYTVADNGADYVQAVFEKHAAKYGPCSAQDLEEAVTNLVKGERLYAYQGTPEQQEKPEPLYHGAEAALYTPQLSDVVITPLTVQARGWVGVKPRAFKLSGKEGANKFLPLLKRLGSLYNRGAKSQIDSMDLFDLELPEGGTLRIQVNNVPPGSMQALGEFFEVLDGVIGQGEYTEAFLEIRDPDEDCLLIQELTKA